MLRIGLIDIDSKIPNLALHKIAKYYEREATIEWNFPLAISTYDKVFVSCVFDWNKKLCKQYEGLPNVEIGGSGYDLNKKLPQEIEIIKPKINLGYTSRGCMRKCEFCIVWKKEGKLHPVGNLLDLWDGSSKEIVLLDNNILGLREHFELICKQAQENKIKVDFNQGLDHRLLDDDICKILKATPHKEYRFAFDKPQYENSVLKAIGLLQKHGIKRAMWFCLVGFDTTIDEDFYRINLLRKYGQTVYVQRYNYTKKKEYINMARWANQHHIFRKMTYEEFCMALKRASS